MSHFEVGCSFGNQFERSEQDTFSFPGVTLLRIQVVLPLLPNLSTDTKIHSTF